MLGALPDKERDSSVSGVRVLDVDDPRCVDAPVTCPRVLYEAAQSAATHPDPSSSCQPSRKLTRRLACSARMAVEKPAEPFLECSVVQTCAGGRILIQDHCVATLAHPSSTCGAQKPQLTLTAVKVCTYRARWFSSDLCCATAARSTKT